MLQPFNLDRRSFLKLAGIGGVNWLTPVGQLLADRAEQDKARTPAQSIIVLWLAGGPSQLETFDPHPGKKIGGDTKAIKTAVNGVQIAEFMPRLAEQMSDVALVRNITSKEGDHERGTYTMKTGYRPDPTIVHPSIGAICCHELPVGKTEIPRHVSILTHQWPARGGFLGDEFDAFKVGDPSQPLPDVTAKVPKERFDQRLKDLDVLERTFAQGRSKRVEATGHQPTINRARIMMSSEQLQAFDTSKEPATLQKSYGDSPFGRGCLAARRLIEAGVRCVEVTLDGWDTHANNHEQCKKLVSVLDPAFATLLKDLKERKLLERTVVLCMGEFGRTPNINPLAGRDHWPAGFSVALAGGGIRGGVVLGETDPVGKPLTDKQATPASHIHATVLTAVGLKPTKGNQSPIGRPILLSEGYALRELLPA